ncbi:MAG: YbhB/YbcL family Raf kinase inhibitor-like protein [bacterium]|nr:YbhB/YbcL family Raf kinase inhibitor-like protein [bacterium]
MIIKSSAFENNSNMPAKYTCDGENISPPIEIGGVPAEAKSLALLMHDPDAPVSGGWDHWIKFNISPETKIIEEGKEPAGVSGKGTRGNLSYNGPCPPSGTHHYVFTIYALDTLLNLPSGASKKEVEQALEGHVLGQGKLVGLYSRQ